MDVNSPKTYNNIHSQTANDRIDIRPFITCSLNRKLFTGYKESSELGENMQTNIEVTVENNGNIAAQCKIELYHVDNKPFYLPDISQRDKYTLTAKTMINLNVGEQKIVSLPYTYYTTNGSILVFCYDPLLDRINFSRINIPKEFYPMDYDDEERYRHYDVAGYLRYLEPDMDSAAAAVQN